MARFERDSLKGFDEPTAEPRNREERLRWQAANRSWWEDHPMRYDWNSAIADEEFSREFFLEIDGRFFSNVRHFMPWRSIPFDPLIDFEALGGQDVLEIGVGNGSHAQLLASHARRFTGIDLTSYAIQSTSERMKCFDLEADILTMDAENLEFPDESFDFIWTWGVIHHSSNTGEILREMRRVLRPGGKAVVMVYHRGWFNYYLLGLVMHGILRGDLFKTRSLSHTMQRMTDGALARYYSPSEWRKFASSHFEVNSVRVYGSKEELIALPASGLKDTLARSLPDPLARFFLNRCKFGSFLVSELQKPDHS